MTAFSVRRAQADEALLVSDLWRQGAAHQRAIGSPVWWLDTQTDLACAERHVQARDAYLIWDGEMAVGAFLLQEEDVLFWDDYPTGQALYLHRIVVSRSAAGGTASAAALAYAQGEAKRLGRSSVRLDTAPIPKLCEAYERLGFVELDRCRKGGFDVVRLEVKL